MKLAIEGSLANREYETKTGEKRQITEIRVQEFEFLGSKKASVNAIIDDNDDLPF